MKVSLKPYTGPPYLWKVLVNGKWKKMSGFDEEHIQNQSNTNVSSPRQRLRSTWARNQSKHLYLISPTYPSSKVFYQG